MFYKYYFQRKKNSDSSVMATGQAQNSSEISVSIQEETIENERRLSSIADYQERSTSNEQSTLQVQRVEVHQLQLEMSGAYHPQQMIKKDQSQVNSQ